MDIAFLLNGETVTLRDVDPTTTALDWLRETRGLTGTKEGCNEGDCGACTVMVTDTHGSRALNACLLFLPQLDGKALTTVEGLAAPDGSLHPVQQAMVEHHGSQCGFCTPGIVVSLAAGQIAGETDHARQLAGNLCRCTGYAPILKAAEIAAPKQVPKWLRDLPTGPDPRGASQAHLPATIDSLAAFLTDHPGARIVAGATDVALWVNKQFRDLGEVVFVSQIEEMARIETAPYMIRIGAAASIEALRLAMADHHPHFADMLARFSSAQVRSAATVGGNIANGSPIGDAPPPLIALGATLILRRGEATRRISSSTTASRTSRPASLSRPSRCRAPPARQAGCACTNSPRGSIKTSLPCSEPSISSLKAEKFNLPGSPSAAWPARQNAPARSRRRSPGSHGRKPASRPRWRRWRRISPR